MSAAQHTPTTADAPPSIWRVAAGDPSLVCAPGIVKPIKVGSAERAARIVQCVNAHDDMLAALHAALDEVCNVTDDNARRCASVIRGAIAKATGSAA